MLPVLFELGPVKLYSMGVMMALGIISSLYWWWKMGRDEHWEEIALFDAYFLAVFGFFVFGRIGYVIISSEIGGFWQGLSLLSKPGIYYLVGVWGAILAVSMVARAKEWEIWKVWDALTVSLSLALVWGAIGILLNRGEWWLDGWGIGLAVVGFGLTTSVRKNFRFYSWYKRTASVAKDGLAALVGLGTLGLYYLGRGIIVRNLWLGIAGGVLILIVGGVIVRRAGNLFKNESWPTIDVVQWGRNMKRRKQ